MLRGKTIKKTEEVNTPSVRMVVTLWGEKHLFSGRTMCYVHYMCFVHFFLSVLYFTIEKEFKISTTIANCRTLLLKRKLDYATHTLNSL